MPLSHAILGFLEYRPMSGYDLKKYFDQSVAHFWSATQSHIYKALEELEGAGQVEANLIVQEGKPNRKLYRITPAGQAELARWLKTPLPVEPVRQAWLIQVFFAHSLRNEDLVELFEARLAQIEARLEGYRQQAQAALERNAAQAGQPRLRALWQITLDNGIDYYEFELGWLRKTLARLRSLPPLERRGAKNETG
jgi:DNA-binding PadR family transcriptional regulator